MSREAFRIELEHLINRESMEARGANTPDGILADYLVGCLQVFDRTVRARESWYGRNPERGPASAGELLPVVVRPETVAAFRPFSVDEARERFDGSNGGHKYIVDGTSDCAFGCGCWAGPYSSGGPPGVDPLGPVCPANPARPPAGRIAPADEPTPVERPQRDLASQLVEALETWMRRRHLRIGVGWTDERENVCADPRYKAAMEAAGSYGDLGGDRGYGYPGSPDGQLTSVPAHVELLKALDADISDAKGDVLEIIREMIPALPR